MNSGHLSSTALLENSSAMTTIFTSLENTASPIVFTRLATLVEIMLAVEGSRAYALIKKYFAEPGRALALQLGRAQVTDVVRLVKAFNKADGRDGVYGTWLAETGLIVHTIKNMSTVENDSACVDTCYLIGEILLETAFAHSSSNLDSESFDDLGEPTDSSEEAEPPSSPLIVEVRSHSFHIPPLTPFAHKVVA